MLRLIITLIGARGLAAVLQLVLNVLLARWTSPSAFGEVAFVISASTVLFIFADFGMSTYIIRASARHQSERVKSALRFNYVSSLLSSVLGMILVLGVEAIPYTLVPLAVAYAFEKSGDCVLGVLIAADRRFQISLAVLGRRVLALGVFLLATVARCDTVLAYSIAMLVGAMAYWIYVRFSISQSFASRLESISFRVLLKEASPYFVANISATSRNLDVPIISAISGSHASGLWAVAQRLTNPLMLIPGAVSSAVLPHASRSQEKSPWRIGKRLAAAHFGVAVLMIVPSIFGEEICVVLFGDQYASAGKVLAFLLLAFPFIALSTSLGGLLQGYGESKYVAKNGVIFAVVLVLGISSIYIHDSLGLVAFLVFCTYLCKSIALIVRIWRLRRQPSLSR